jgi:putative acetyltransferase
MVTIRVAERRESDICAEILREAWQGMWFVPQDLHTPAEDRRWMRDVFQHQLVLVAEERPGGGDDDDVQGRIVGFLTMGDGTVHNLYIRPTHQARGIGHSLMETAKVSSGGELKLWVFEPNEHAIRFYERHGFTTLRKTDGRDNEEKVPDRQMIWQHGAEAG